jgi:hypothetical protein
MRKYINIVLAALVTLTVFSCTKKADVDTTESKLPAIQLSSIGYQQSGPFTINNTVLQVNFGATLTNQQTGAFKVEIYEQQPAVGTPPVAPAPELKATVNFASWNGTDDTSIPTKVVHSISTAEQSTTYHNTQVYAGSILLKLSALNLTSGKIYNIKAYAFNKDGSKSSTISQTTFFTTK